MACDICGKTGTPLEDVKSEYKTEDIQCICSDCSRLATDHIWKLHKLTRKANCTFIKRFLIERKVRFTKG